MIHRVFPKLMLAAVFSVVLCNAQDFVKDFVDEARHAYSSVGDNILKSAEAMPTEEYAFRPTPSSPTFGQLISDIAASQDRVCSAVEGTGFQAEGPLPRAKNDFVEALGQSVRRCARAYAFVNSVNASGELEFEGSRHSRLGLLFLNASRCEEVYGRLAVYLRLRGLVPPSSQARFVPVEK